MPNPPFTHRWAGPGGVVLAMIGLRRGSVVAVWVHERRGPTVNLGVIYSVQDYFGWYLTQIYLCIDESILVLATSHHLTLFDTPHMHVQAPRRLQGTDDRASRLMDPNGHYGTWHPPNCYRA